MSVIPNLNASKAECGSTATLLASKIMPYAQGYLLLREALSEYNWTPDYGDIAQNHSARLKRPVSR